MVPKDRIYPVLVKQARYVAPDISGVSKSRVNRTRTLAGRLRIGASTRYNTNIDIEWG